MGEEKLRNLLKVQKLALLPECVTTYSQEAIARWDGVDSRSLYHRGGDTWKYGFTALTKNGRDCIRNPSECGEVEGRGIVFQVALARRPSRRHGDDMSDDEVKAPGKALRSVQNEDPDLHQEDSGGHNYKYGPGDCDSYGKDMDEKSLFKSVAKLPWKSATFDDAEKFSRIAALENEWGAISFLKETVRHVFHDSTYEHSATVKIADCNVRVVFSYRSF